MWINVIVFTTFPELTYISFPGNLEALNTQNHGLVEICCLEGHTDVLEFLESLKRAELQVWKKLLKFCSSDLEEEAECAGKSLCKLTEPKDDMTNLNWRNVYDNGGIAALVKVCTRQSF